MEAFITERISIGEERVWIVIEAFVTGRVSYGEEIVGFVRGICHWKSKGL
jgi:hypothetical protein